MSRYFSLFETEAQYQEQTQTLGNPNVSLIDTTGTVKYSVFKGVEVLDAPFGSIMMANVSTNKLFYISNSEYNSTAYPFDTYKPIGVCIYDKASNANNQAVFLSVQWADNSALGQGKPSSKKTTWGFSGVNLSASVSGIRDTGTNHVSSLYINSAVKPLVTADYSGSSIGDNSGAGQSTTFCCCWRYSTPGTKEGDWLLPSYYDLMKYKQNYSTINSVFTNIKSVIGGTSYINTVSDSVWSSTESGDYLSTYLTTSGNFTSYGSKNMAFSAAIRPVFVAYHEEL